MSVRRFAVGLAVLALFIATAFAALATPFAAPGSGSSTSVEIDVDAPKRPAVKTPKATVYKAPPTKRR